MLDIEPGVTFQFNPTPSPLKIITKGTHLRHGSDVSHVIEFQLTCHFKVAVLPDKQSDMARGAHHNGGPTSVQ